MEDFRQHLIDIFHKNQLVNTPREARKVFHQLDKRARKAGREDDQLVGDLMCHVDIIPPVTSREEMAIIAHPLLKVLVSSGAYDLLLPVVGAIATAPSGIPVSDESSARKEKFQRLDLLKKDYPGAIAELAIKHGNLLLQEVECLCCYHLKPVFSGAEHLESGRHFHRDMKWQLLSAIKHHFFSSTKSGSSLGLS